MTTKTLILIAGAAVGAFLVHKHMTEQTPPASQNTGSARVVIDLDGGLPDIVTMSGAPGYDGYDCEA